MTCYGRLLDHIRPDGFAAIAVGLTVGFCAMVGGPLTGASMNPARSLGPALAGNFWPGHWIYWAAPVTAMMFAARVYDQLRHVEPPPGPREEASLGVQGPIAGGTNP
jgi:glycerol uptake facilitator-like aquaporin